MDDLGYPLPPPPSTTANNSLYGLCEHEATFEEEEEEERVYYGRGEGRPGTLRASLSGTFLQKKDAVNECLQFGGRGGRVPATNSSPQTQRVERKERRDVITQYRAAMLAASRELYALCTL